MFTHEVNKVFTHLEINNFIKQIVDNLTELFHAENIFFYLLETNNGFGKGSFVHFQLNLSAAKKISDRLSTVNGDIIIENDHVKKLFEGYSYAGTHSLAVMPLFFKQTLLGFIVIDAVVYDKYFKQLNDYIKLVSIVAMQLKEAKSMHENLVNQSKLLYANKNKLFPSSNATKAGFWEYDIKNKMFEFTNNFYAIFKTSVAEESRFLSLDDYIKEFVYSEDAALVRSEVNSLVRSVGQTKFNDIRYRIVRRDGEIRTILSHRISMTDENDAVLKLYGTIEDVTELVKIEHRRVNNMQLIRRLAYSDSLTNLPNRHSLRKYLSDMLKHVYEKNLMGAIFFIDLDDLKIVNDAYGHVHGRKIIRIVARRISAIIGKKAFVFRIGGDEFAIVLEGVVDKQELSTLANRILHSIAERQYVFRSVFNVTASMGIAIYPKDGDTLTELLKNADNAMYSAKTAGKNRWRFYTRKMQYENYTKIKLSGNLRDAIKNDELYLVYQPQVSSVEEKIIGFEALLRWDSHEYGPVSPVQFIPVAEQLGLIVEIGKWVLYKACSFIKELVDAGRHDIHIAVNISPRQIERSDFVSLIRDAIETTGILPDNLELEVTETVCINSFNTVIQKLNEIRSIGVHLSLDDFGTGFSSFSYLRKLPFRTLKIDKSFVDTIETDTQSAQIVESIIKLAHVIDMTVVAEGVETQNQLKYLIGNDCDYIQGYIYSKPLTKSNAKQFLVGSVS